MAVDKLAAGMYLGIGLGFILAVILTYFGEKITRNRDMEKRIEEIEKKMNQ